MGGEECKNVLEQKKRGCSFPESAPMVTKLFGVPFVILNAVWGTTTMDCRPDPLHFEQSLQWQSALAAGSPDTI